MGFNYHSVNQSRAADIAMSATSHYPCHINLGVREWMSRILRILLLTAIGATMLSGILLSILLWGDIWFASSYVGGMAMGLWCLLFLLTLPVALLAAVLLHDLVHRVRTRTRVTSTRGQGR